MTFAAPGVVPETRPTTPESVITGMPGRIPAAAPWSMISDWNQGERSWWITFAGTIGISRWERKPASFWKRSDDRIASRYCWFSSSRRASRPRSLSFSSRTPTSAT